MMRLELTRTYDAKGVNGRLLHQGQLICETIELPWRNNKKSISCIPEGQYQIIKRMHPKHGAQLQVINVPHREGILIHPANFALSELQGCIAPVSKCTHAGKGIYSRIAMERLQNLVDPVLTAGEKVWLVIKSVT